MAIRLGTNNISKIYNGSNEVSKMYIGANEFYNNAPLGLWTPANITTELWLDASDSSSIIESGGLVSQWSDKSGKGYNYLQTVGSNQPIIGTRTINSLPTLDFDGSSKRMILSNGFQPSTNNTMTFVVGTTDTVTLVNNQRIFQNQAGTGTRFGIYLETTFPTLLAYVNAGSFQYVSTNYVQGTSLMAGYRNDSILGVGYNGTYTTNGNTGTVSTLTSWTLGAFNNAGSYNNHFDGTISEIVVVFSYDLTTRQKIEGYLAHKWGLQGSLPLDHPYKSSAPLS